MPDDQHVRRSHLRRDPGLLRPVHEVIDEHAEPAGGRGGEAGDDRRQVVDALEVLHDDADVAQVVAPDLLDQLGIVAALDVDAARLGDLGPARRCRDRSRRGSRGCPGGTPCPSGPACGPGRTSCTGLPSSRKGAGLSGNTRRLPWRSSSVTASFSQNTTAPQNSAAAVLDDQAALGWHLRKLTLPGARTLLGEHVLAVLSAPHDVPPRPFARSPRRQFPAKHRNEPRPLALCATRHAAPRVHAGGWPDWTSIGALPAGDTPIWACPGSWISVTSNEPIPRVTWALLAGLRETRYSKVAMPPGEII